MNKYKVLIVAPAWVGDIVMSYTLIKLLKDEYGDSLELHVFVSQFAMGLVRRMPEVNQVIANLFGHGSLSLRQRVSQGLSLRVQHYDQVFILPNSFKSAIMPYFAGIRKRTGFVGEFRYGLINDIHRLDKQKYVQMVERFSALLLGERALLGNLPKPMLTVDLANQKKLAQKYGLDNKKPLIAFCPAAEYGPAKRWPPEYFAKLSDALVAESCQIVIMGGAKDIEIAEKIIDLAGNLLSLVNICGQTSLVDAIDLLGMARLVVTNDSGLMHVACALDTQVIAIYGSSSPKFTPPLSSKAEIVRIDLDCSPCFQRTCRYGHYNCLWGITPDLIAQKVKHILGNI